MAKGSKLKQALDRYKGVDHKLEKQKKQQKQAEKRKRAKAGDEKDTEILEEAVEKAEEAAEEPAEVPKDAVELKKERSKKRKRQAAREVDETSAAVAADEDQEDGASEGSEEWETDEEDGGVAKFDTSRLDDSDTSESESEIDQADGGAQLDEEGENEEQEDIPLSDIESVASEDKQDIVPHQRLTINNTTALLKAHKSIALSSKFPFSEVQSVTTSAPVEIVDIDDDLNRELAFYRQSLDAVTQARALLKAEGVPFSRPVDYFAEMVKSDEHMGKIKQKLVDDAASKRAAADARKQRDLKKFGKQVQIAKLQERDKTKRETMEKINLLKRKRQGADIGAATEEDLFDVALEDAAETERKDRDPRRAGGGRGGRGGAASNFKRQKRDEKYGFGGKKRFAKSNDARSSADTRGFSVSKMKGRGGAKRGSAPRPGKSKRTNKA
ncbi:rRNA-processing protein EBP2 [Taxawa tesnikishii (nom. ined.)]|nr:rRNA-processing protein EBP2 [Dothideales sp. JES 119]